MQKKVQAQNSTSKYNLMKFRTTQQGRAMVVYMYRQGQKKINPSPRLDNRATVLTLMLPGCCPGISGASQLGRMAYFEERDKAVPDFCIQCLDASSKVVTQNAFSCSFR